MKESKELKSRGGEEGKKGEEGEDGAGAKARRRRKERRGVSRGCGGRTRADALGPINIYHNRPKRRTLRLALTRLL